MNDVNNEPGTRGMVVTSNAFVAKFKKKIILNYKNNKLMFL